MDSKEQDVFLDNLWGIFEEIPEEDRFVFARCIIDVASICGTDSHVERIGLLQLSMLSADKEFDEEYEEKRQKETNLKVVPRTKEGLN